MSMKLCCISILKKLTKEMGTSYLFYDRLCVTNCQNMRFASCLLYVDTTMAHSLCQVFQIFIGKGQVRGLE